VLNSFSPLGGTTFIGGTLTTSVGCTIAGFQITNLNITAASGVGDTHVIDCTVTGTLNKSGNAAYTEIAHCDINTSCNVTGTGLVVNVNNNLNFLTVNNAAANVLVKAAKSCVAPVALAGTLNLVDSTVIAAAAQWVSGTTYAVGNLVYDAGATYARIVAGDGTTAPASDAVNWLVQAAFGASDTRNAITTVANTVVILANSQVITPTYDGVARVSLSGFYSIFNCVFDKPNSTLVAQSGTGGSTNSVDYFQYINADNIYTKALSASGTISTTGLLSAVAAVFEGSVVEGIGGEATGLYSHAEGAYNKATASYAHAEGGSITDPLSRNIASGTSSHAEGRGTVASGQASHAEGTSTQALGIGSHAEGLFTQALGLGSHAEGLSSIAFGDYSHAAGQNTYASGTRSYTTGQSTSATKVTSYAHGRFTLANNARAWVWQGTGTENLVFSSTRNDQFALRPEGGLFLSGTMGINTDSIDNALTVVGDISANGNVTSINSANWDTAYNRTTTLASASAKWIKSDTSLVTSTPSPSAITNIVTLSQTAYNSLSPNYSPSTLYIIV
jgi:hypothetical protein